MHVQVAVDVVARRKTAGDRETLRRRLVPPRDHGAVGALDLVHRAVPPDLGPVGGAAAAQVHRQRGVAHQPGELRPEHLGVIRLEQLPQDFGKERRRTSIIKMRGIKFRGGFHDYVLDTGGITVFPRLVAAEHKMDYVPLINTTGSPGIDALLGGGLSAGTNTLVVGPSGIGKTTLSARCVLSALERGGTLAVAGIHLSDIPQLNYQQHLFQERTLRSVTANTRADGSAFLEAAARVPVSASTVAYRFEHADVALRDLAEDRVRGAAVLTFED